MPEQKDILTLGALLFPLYWASRYRPFVPGIEMNRRRMLALCLAIGIMALMAGSLFRDAGSFLGGGFWVFVEILIGWLSFILLVLTIFVPVGLYFGLDKSQSEEPANYVHPETDEPLSVQRRKFHAILLFVLLTLAISHAIARIIHVWEHGIRIDLSAIGPHVYLPSHPLFILVFGVLGIWANNRILGGARLVKRGVKANATSKKPAQKASPKPQKNKDAFAVVMFTIIFLLGGYQAVGFGKTLLLLVFALMIGVIAIRNPHRMIQLGWTVVFLLGCALGAALFDHVLGLVETASESIPLNGQ